MLGAYVGVGRDVMCRNVSAAAVRWSVIGAEAEMHLDLCWRWFARDAPGRKARRRIRIGGKIDRPALCWRARQRQADGAVARLVHQRRRGNDRFLIAVMRAPVA